MAHTTEEWVAAVAKIRGYVQTYLGLKELTPHQQVSLQTDLATLDADLAELSASLKSAAKPVEADKPVEFDDPNLVPTSAGPGGELFSVAALLDAQSIAAVNNGDDPIPAAANYAGQAAKEGFSGVIGVGGGSSITFTVFLDGAVVAVEQGDSTTDTAALGAAHGVPA